MILTIMIFGSLIMVASAETYISYVDDILGFYKIRDVTTPTNNFTYEKRVLTINQGDTIIWENDAQKTSFTIVSEQNLWDDKVGYLRVGSKLNYKFDKPGKYTVYVKEYSSIRQTVVINSVDGYSIPTVISTTIVTTVPTPVKTPVSVNTISSNKTNITPVPTMTSIVNIPINSTENSTGYSIQFPDIKLPIRISITTIASIIVAILSIIITYKTGKNKR